MMLWILVYGSLKLEGNVILIAVVILMVYFLNLYNCRSCDVLFKKEFLEAGKDITRDLSGNVKTYDEYS